MDLISSPSPSDLSPDAYWRQNGGASWSLSESAGVFRFEVRAGDHWPGDPPGSGKERSEIARKSPFVFGRTYRIRYQFVIEPGPANTSDWMVLGQIHQTDDPGAGDLSPPFEVDLNGERMALVVRWASGPGARPVSYTLWSDDAAVRRGRWYDMIVDVRFDPFGEGVLAVRRDGVRLASYRGPLGFANEVGPYWKNGVYRSAAPETIVVRFRGLSIDEARAPLHFWGAGERPAPDPGRQAQPKK